MLMQNVFKECKIEQPESYVKILISLIIVELDLVRELQWLSISQRINYFLCVLVFNCIHGNAPRYLSDSFDMASHMHDRNTRQNMSSLGRTHFMRSSFI